MGLYLGLDSSTQSLSALVVDTESGQVVLEESVNFGQALPEEKGRIDLLLSDMIMPRMNGRDLRDVLSVLYPGLRVIFMSGYTGDVLSGLGDLDGDVQLVPKPFTPDVLLQGVQKALGR